jgi:hypothetical protein
MDAHQAATLTRQSLAGMRGMPAGPSKQVRKYGDIRGSL